MKRIGLVVAYDWHQLLWLADTAKRDYRAGGFK